MKLWMTFPLALVFAVLSFAAARQLPSSDTRLAVGYVSARRVVAETDQGKAQVARVQALQQRRTSELRARQQTLEDIRQQLTKTADGPARTQLEEQELQQRNDLNRATLQAQVEMQNLQRQLQSDLLDEVKDVLDDVVRTKNVQLVLNEDQAVLWGMPGMDLTADVVAALNDQAGSSTGR